MNKTVDYSKLSLAEIAVAKWPYKVVSHNGKNVGIAFTTPMGGEERRTVSVDRLGTVARARVGRFDFDHGVTLPRRKVQVRTR